MNLKNNKMNNIKNNKMKSFTINQLIYKLGILFTVLFISCSDDLKEVPPSLLAPENFYKTNEEAIISVNACYQSLKDNFISNGYGTFIFIDSSSDCYDTNPVIFSSWFAGTLSSTDTNIQLWWQRYYTTIGACNVTIARVEQAAIDTEIQNRVIAEAKFLRAFNYFHVVQLWGPAPLKTSIPLGSDDANLVRAPIKDIYDTIITDLKFAEEHCWNVGETKQVGGKSYTNDRGRITKGAAKALLAKVYLKLASTSRAANARTDTPLLNSATGQVDGLEAYKIFDATTYYTKCIEKCVEVEGLGFTLNANYMDNFDKTKKNGPESLFEIQSFNQLGYGSRLAPFYSPPYSGTYGGTWGGIIGFHQPFLLNKGPFKIYKNANFDYRPAVSGDLAGKVTSSQFDITDQRYKSGFAMNYNQSNRPYTWDAGSSRYIGTPSGQNVKFFTSKYYDLNGKVVDDNGNNFVVLRYADVLLMKAECLFETGNLSAAWSTLTMVHTRNGNQNVSGTTIFPNNYTDWISRFTGTSTDEQFREAILYERMMELFMEGHRFFDICRMGKLEEKCAITGRVKTRRHYYFPIAQSEMNNNKAITNTMNNPGY
jgi:hypothetical protein